MERMIAPIKGPLHEDPPPKRAINTIRIEILMSKTISGWI